MEIKSEQLWSLVRPRLRSYLGRTWDFDTVAQVTGSTVQTVAGWLAGQAPPAERLIKLWHVLAILGYESLELEELPAFNRYCGELLTFGGVGNEELQHIWGLHHSQGVLAALRGTPPMHPQYTLEELRVMYDVTLQDAKSSFLQGRESPASQQGDLTARSSVDTSVITVLQGMDDVLFTATLLGALLPLLRHLNSDECTPQERSLLRTLVGNDEMFDISNLTSDLCSERARQHGRKNR